MNNIAVDAPTPTPTPATTSMTSTTIINIEGALKGLSFMAF